MRAGRGARERARARRRRMADYCLERLILPRRLRLDWSDMSRCGTKEDGSENDDQLTVECMHAKA